ncbi:MAG: hypothetical protein A4E58_02114 [Syntrophorhabdus sp. PtaB.Bin006]|nr:MAG: hypothetical protein A4E58_02114 [Syntrophorhabdus sp. PtaB.Bin006]OPY77797.1 MAG: hypothetical protein A4E65_02591 [Syntrophorhabdus sp. PtaU1.Bin153]
MTNTAYSLNGDDILKIMQGMYRQGMGSAKLAQVHHILRSNVTEKIEDGTLERIDKILLGIEGKEQTLANEVRDWVLSSSGVFLSSQVVKELSLSSRSDIKNVSKILERMAKPRGIIDKHGDKRGCYRLRETNLEEINFMGSDDTPLNILWPFYLESFYDVYPKTIAVVAGEPDSGKTAFLFRFCELNMESHQIVYFNSEQGKHELKNRLKKFEETPLEKWQTKIKWYERSTNFHDVINPDAINVIDFLELHDDFFLIAKLLKQIHNKLRKGIAVIALQKDPGKSYGKGGIGGLELPRLYLTLNKCLDHNTLKIEKCKNWHLKDLNPNRMEGNFKLVQGHKFVYLTPGILDKPEPRAPKKAKPYRDFLKED